MLVASWCWIEASWLTLPHPDRTDSYHGILRTALFVSFHRGLHRQAPIETDSHESLERNEIRHGGECSVLAERVARERHALLNKAFEPHVFKRCLLQYRDGGLSELRGVYKTFGIGERVRGGLVI